MAPVNIPVGTLVAIKDVHRTSKNEPTMLSPYMIHARAENGGYLVRDMAGGILQRAVPTEHIRPLFHARKPDSSETAYMDFIHGKRVNPVSKRDEYLVKWSGSPLSESTWLDFSDIHDYAAITQYLASLERIPKSRQKTRDATRIATALSETLPAPVQVIVKSRVAKVLPKTTTSAALAAPTFNLSSRGRLSKRL